MLVALESRFVHGPAGAAAHFAQTRVVAHQVLSYHAILVALWPTGAK